MCIRPVGKSVTLAVSTGWLLSTGMSLPCLANTWYHAREPIRG